MANEKQKVYRKPKTNSDDFEKTKEVFELVSKLGTLFKYALAKDGIEITGISLSVEKIGSTDLEFQVKVYTTC